MRRRVEVVVADNTAVDRDYEGFRDEIFLPETLPEYKELWAAIEQERTAGNAERWRALMRLWSAGDLYFFVLFVLRVGQEAWSAYRHEPQFWHPSYLTFAREIQFEGSRAAFIATRRFGKSTFGTLGDNMQRKLRNPNDSTCIFSLTRELAEDHLDPIMAEMKDNALLKGLWDDRFYWDPEKAGAIFGLKDGVNIKRVSSRPEKSFEARAFATRLPTGMGYDRRYYDDVEADSTVQSEVSMETAEQRYVSSQNLRSSAGDDLNMGTYYHPGGLVRKWHKEYGRKLFLYAGEDRSEGARAGLLPAEAGPMGGRPRHGFTREQLFDLWKDAGCERSMMGRADYGRQIACDPLAGEGSRFNRALIRTYDEDPFELASWGTIYVCQDAASGTVKDGQITIGEDACFTWVWLLRPDKTFWWIDGWRKRVPPARRKELTYQTMLQWNSVGYLAAGRIEQYGQSEYVQQQLVYNWRRDLFVRIEICNDNSMSKRDREWERWDAILAAGFYVPKGGMHREDEDGNSFDLVEKFIEEELGEFPKPLSDHGLDAGGLIMEPARKEVLPLEWPAARRRAEYDDHGPPRQPSTQSLGAGGVL
jgi:hypothetical protein